MGGVAAVNREGVHVDPEPAQGLHLAQDEAVRDRRILVEQVGDARRAADPRRRGCGRLRLAFITEFVTPYAVAVLSELARLSDLTVIFAAARSVRGCDWEFDELPFKHAIVGGPALKRPDPGRADYYFSPEILRRLRAASPDVVISGGWSIPTWYAALYGRLSGSPLVVFSDGTSLRERGLNVGQRLSRRLLVRTAAAFAANSRQARARFIELGAPPQRVHDAPHSTGLDRYWELARRRRVSEGPLHLLMVGRLVREKGFEEALRAIAEAQRSEPDIRVSIAGSGPEMERLRARGRELSPGNVELLGFVDQPELPAVYERADALLFPSLEEQFGFVLLEAQAAGLACIASPFAGATIDLVRHGDNGLVVDPRDRAALSAAIVRLRRDPELRRRLGDRAFASTLERTPRRTAEGYLAAAVAAYRS
jgi:glycosyltransferase involved in cell wall biosynthesis